MTELTERERQIVAWLREGADKLEVDSFYLIGNHRTNILSTVDVRRALADAIERGEPWGEQA